MKTKKILIAGFSGSGKTSLLREIAKTSPFEQWTFADLDQVICQSNQGQSISSLIQVHGWEKFRLWERQELEKWLKKEGKGVLALGGGALSPLVYDLYRRNSQLRFCYLHASFEECWERMIGEETPQRPLKELGKKELFKIYQERQRVFEMIPWRIENSQNMKISAIASLFWDELLL